MLYIIKKFEYVMKNDTMDHNIIMAIILRMMWWGCVNIDTMLEREGREQNILYKDRYLGCLWPKNIIKT